MTDNCWEEKMCPPERRQQCPAYPDNGKSCWLVTGTMCRGEKQSSLQEKMAKCSKCGWYQNVCTHTPPQFHAGK